ncbi:MAG: hydrogenase expression/formation protein HypE [Thermoproteota archaeon]|nr:MAG: hydrogenase expression/formation protein HypE [Candidatus Korarchaeota archaeon]
MEDTIMLAHGSGGLEMEELLEKLLFNKLPDSFKKVEGGYGIDILDDGAAIPLPNGKFLIISTDSYTVNPLFFPGGNIGSLAASGSINDVLMMGGRPIAMLDTMIVGEGFPKKTLDNIIESFLCVLKQENISLIGGDFKVLPRKSFQGITITTTCIGIADKVIVDKRIRPGDKIIVSDFIGDHGAVILALQNGINIENKLKSDVKPLTKLMLPLLEKFSDCIHAARDPTRGGLAMTLNDWAKSSNTTILVHEDNIPIRKIVFSYANMLGIDPLSLASEGVAVLGVESEKADDILECIRELGFSNAHIIGEVKDDEEYNGLVILESKIGGLRILEPPTGTLVPRIC